jgi:hypothetical protein
VADGLVEALDIPCEAGADGDLFGDDRALLDRDVLRSDRQAHGPAAVERGDPGVEREQVAAPVAGARLGPELVVIGGLVVLPAKAE